jgi:hypothetical protein
LIVGVAGAVTNGRGRSAAVSARGSRLVAAAERVVGAPVEAGVLAALVPADAGALVRSGVEAGVGVGVPGAEVLVSRAGARAEVFFAALLPLAAVRFFGIGFFAITGFLRGFPEASV